MSALLASLVGGCGSGTEQLAEPKPQRLPVAFETESPRNLLMIVLDATTARRWPIYGYARQTTPFVSRMAKEAVVFEQAYSQATATVPSAWSYFMGQYAYHPDTAPRLTILRGGVDEPLAVHFRKAGFATGGFSDNLWFRPALGFGKGFDAFETTMPTMDGAKQSLVRDETASEDVLANAKAFIRSVKSERFFCYVHFLRPHNWYVSPEPYLSRFAAAEEPTEGSLETALRGEETRITFGYLRQEDPSAEQVSLLERLYDGNVAYGDHLVEELFGLLAEEELLDDTLVVLMSDHGEAFMEHGKLLHASEPYEELIHVPLVIRAPERAGFVPGRVERPVELVDLVSTFRDLFDLEIAHSLDGESLVPLLRAVEPGPEPETSISDSASTVSVRHGPLKLLMRMDDEYKETLGYELYNLERDPGESNNLFTSVDDVEVLVEMAMDYVSSRTTGEAFSIKELTDDEIEVLKALGYLQ